MKIERLIVVIAFAFSANVVHCIELEPNQNFPADVKKFIEDRESCDHFSSEPREFDTTYYQGGHQDGVALDPEEVERAEFLEKMTAETCYNMDKRLRLLNTKYRANPLVGNKLDAYSYIDIGSCYVEISNTVRFASLIEQRLVAKGFFSSYVNLLDIERWQWKLGSPPHFRPGDVLSGSQQRGASPPEKLTIYISSEVDVFSAQLVIETLLEYDFKEIGVVWLPEESRLWHLFIGMSSVEDSYVYSGAALQRLLTPGLSKKAFRKVATSRATKRN